MLKDEFNRVISSPIRWAGSKKKLLNEMLRSFFVRNVDNYIEPFLGSGVVLINVLNNIDKLGYKNFYVNDINKNIIDFFLLIKNDLKWFVNNFKKIVEEYNSKLTIEEKEEMYYRFRDDFNNKKLSSKKKTIIFYFLMKTGYNGVYRENSSGKFNVPFGKKDLLNFNCDNITEISRLIQPVQFFNLEYNEFFKYIESNDLLDNAYMYCDPPYLPEDKCITKRIDIYTKNSFNHEIFARRIREIKCKNIMISMANSEQANNIYIKGNFRLKDISNIIRTINPKKIFSSNEIAYLNYKIDEK